MGRIEPTTPGQPLRSKMRIIALGIAVPSLAAAGLLLFTLLTAEANAAHPALCAGAATGVVAGVVGAVTLHRIARRMDRALAGLDRSLDAFAAEEGPVQSGIEGADEFAHLAERLQTALAGAHVSRAVARQQEDSLKSVLKARTVELQQKNLALAYQNEKVL